MRDTETGCRLLTLEYGLKITKEASVQKHTSALQADVMNLTKDMVSCTQPSDITIQIALIFRYLLPYTGTDG